MEKEKLIRKLNWFYSLEVNQVDLYAAQSKLVDVMYIKKTLERVSMIEQKHVENIAKKIKELGEKPIFLSDIIAPITGKISGNITGRISIIKLLKINISL